jgi:hypothetical protein
VWCRTACAIGLVDAQESGALTLASGIEPVLADRRSPWYYGGAIGLAVGSAARFFLNCPAVSAPARQLRLSCHNLGVIIPGGAGCHDSIPEEAIHGPVHDAA